MSRTCSELASLMASPLEIVVNILYLLEHQSGEADPQLYRVANRAIARMTSLIREELEEDGSVDQSA